MYRLSETKSVQIGKIVRFLKENAIDCLFNVEQNELIESVLNKKSLQKLSTGSEIQFPIGYKNNSKICDFMNCEYKFAANIDNEKLDESTYNYGFISMNVDRIIKEIKNIFKERYFINTQSIIEQLTTFKNFSEQQILNALDIISNNKNENC